MESPVGVGPFTYHQFDKGSPGGELRRSENYWGDEALIDAFHIGPVVQDGQTQYILYENGEIDILYADDVRQPQVHNPDNPHFGDLESAAHAGIWLDAFDQSHPPFDELLVRKAFAHSVDMDAIVKAVFGPLADPARGVLTKGAPCNQQPEGKYEFNPELARQALAESSYGGPDNLPTITIALSNASMIRVHEFAQQQWNDNLGVQINMIRLEKGMKAPKVIEMKRTSGSAQIADSSEMIHRFGHSNGVSNRFSKHNIPDLDAAIDRALTLSLNDPNRCPEFLKIEREILDNYLWLPINASASRLYLKQPWVMGWQGAWNRFMSTLPSIQVGVRDRALY
jgi:ABC-type oligopeptide transport system substrate-binding subunit